MLPTLRNPLIPRLSLDHVTYPEVKPVPEGVQRPFWSVIIPTYNRPEYLPITLRSVLDQAPGPDEMQIIVVDNASGDGSADAVARAFPQVELVRSAENVGFAAANNRAVAGHARGDWLLLLNPDTEVHETEAGGAVDALMDFARARPQAGIWGGRTVFPDGSLNIASCWRRITPWSALCMATGLTAAFPRSELFNPEAMPSWARDSVREVDVVVGCLMLIRRDLWETLGGFDLRYWMYGEEADLCARARARGWRPAVTLEEGLRRTIRWYLDHRPWWHTLRDRVYDGRRLGLAS